jgi:hypothetical protein
MGTSGRPSISKRQKEQARAQKQREKAVKRQQRRLDRQNPGGPEKSGQTDEAGLGSTGEAGGPTDPP